MALLVVVLTLIAGCSVRLDTPPPAIPSPDHDETVRQEHAEQVTQILDLVEATTAAADVTDEVAVILATVAADAEEQLAALGGVWEPPPRPEEADGSSAEPSPATDPSPGADQVMSELEASAETARLAAPEVEGDLATLLVSVGTNHVLQAQALRTALDIGAPEPAGRPDDPYPQILGAEAATLCRVLDAAGYVAELRAARSSGDERTNLQQRGEDLRAAADLIAVRADFAGTADDPREARYDVDPEDLAAEAAALELALVPAWLDLLAPAEGADRELIAWQVYTAAAAAYSSDLPAFPGRG